MPLTYAVFDDFVEMKDLEKSGIVVDAAGLGKKKIQQYLLRATRYIQRHTRRDFFPWREIRKFPVPYAFYDLAMRRFPSAHLQLDQDLLEVYNLNNGEEDIDTSFYYSIPQNIKPHYAIAIKFPKYWGGAYGGVKPYTRFDESIIEIDALWGYAENTGGWRYPDDFWVNTTYTLESPLNDSDTVISISSVETITDDLLEKAFVSGRLLQIDSEMLSVEEVDTDANTITVRRGIRGTSSEAHEAGDTIFRWRVIDDITEACLQIAKTWREADISTGSRIGVSDVSPGAELSIPSDPLTVLASYHRSMLLE